MGIDENACYRAMIARDSRFDGKFFVGVKTTGIYCRPICPARPKRENVEFFPSALLAEEGGYRPCMRCRPECAPLSAAWMGKSAIVQRALRLIAIAEPGFRNEEDFAAQLGVSARHLRRLFEKEIGKTPRQIFADNRLGFARKLIVETHLPITEIAFGAGFASIRRFNDAFLERFRRPPSAFRKGAQTSAVATSMVLSLPFRPPLDWDSLLAYHEIHPVKWVDSVTGGRYRRVFKIGGVLGAFSVQSGGVSSLRLEVAASDPRILRFVVQGARRMFDLDSDPLVIAGALSSCPILGRLIRKRPGLRLPRAWDAFEASICLILGQLVSTAAAAELIRQVVEAYGEPVRDPLDGTPSFLFPEAAVLADETLAQVRTTNARRQAIREFSSALLSGRISLNPAQDPQEFRRLLCGLPGIGPWTAETISLHALGDADAFPATDLVLKRAIRQETRMALDSVRPWRAYAAMHLWKEKHLWSLPSGN